MMNRICKQCAATFQVRESEKRLLERISPVLQGQLYPIALPKLCRGCREQRRLAFRNERKLYHRNCDLTGQKMVSIFSPDKKYKVYHYDAWWSDKWDAADYAKGFDFNRPFFEQFHELWKEVPQIGLLSSRNHNSEYTNFSEQERNCYLVFASNRNEDCLYSEYIWDSRNCVDCSNVENSERLYMCLDCSKAYDCAFCQECHSSHELRHCFDCQGCSNLYACSGLRKKSYCILNEQLSEHEYRRRISDPEELQQILEKYAELKGNTPRRYAKILRCENVTGSNLIDCRNLQHAFNVFQSEDGKFLENVPGKTKDIIDINGATNSELAYELVSVAYGYQVAFSLYSHTGLSSSFYTVSCHSSKNLFGCIGIRSREHCILNKQYSAKDYEAIVLRIIEHMQRTGEWGEFFPVNLSPWCYNETAASDTYPLDDSEVKKRGWSWHIEEEESFTPGEKSKIKPAAELPSNSRDVDQSITGGLILCEATGKPYKIIPPELKFYQSAGLALPRISPAERYKRRIQMQLPKRLWQRQCDNKDKKLFVDNPDYRCSHVFQTPYSSQRTEKVFCEECYLGTVY